MWHLLTLKRNMIIYTDKQNSGFRNNKGSQMIDRKVMKLQYIWKQHHQTLLNINFQHSYKCFKTLRYACQTTFCIRNVWDNKYFSGQQFFFTKLVAGFQHLSSSKAKLCKSCYHHLENLHTFAWQQNGIITILLCAV